MSNFYISNCCGEQVDIPYEKDAVYSCLGCGKECEVTPVLDTPNSVPKVREEVETIEHLVTVLSCYLEDKMTDETYQKSIDYIKSWLEYRSEYVESKLTQRTAEAISDYQTNYEQQHLVSAIELARKERTAEIKSLIIGMVKEPTDLYDLTEEDKIRDKVISEILVALRKFY